jgi:hypothetical protein
MLVLVMSGRWRRKPGWMDDGVRRRFKLQRRRASEPSRFLILG